MTPAARGRLRAQLEEQKLDEIRAWFGRHSHDYDPVSPHSPPKVWAEYFEWLLDRCAALLGVQQEEEQQQNDEEKTLTRVDTPGSSTALVPQPRTGDK